MTQQHRHDPTRRKPTPAFHRIRAGVTASLVVGLATGGCNGNDREATLPSSSAPAAPTNSLSPGSASEAIKQAYSRYWAVLPKAEQASALEDRRRLLADYVTQPLLNEVLGNIDRLHAKHLTSTGFVVVHVERVQVKEDQATVWDCQDSTHALLKNSQTGQVTSRGTPNDHLRASLTRGTDGRWRVSRFTPLGRC